MENGKHKTNSFNSLNSWSKKANLLPSFQGGAGGRLFLSQGAAHPQNKCSKCFRCFRCFRCFISLLDKKNARFWSKSEQNRCFRCFKCFKCSASLLPSFQGGAGGRLFPLTKCEAWLTLFYIGVLCDARFALTKIIPKKSVSKKVAIRR